VSSDPHAQHNLDTLNNYRVQAGAPALAISDELSRFSYEASVAFAQPGAQAHAYFLGAGDCIWQDGFCSNAEENQAPDWPAADVDATIDAILQAMMDEGPGGGHHDNIMDPNNRLVGIGLFLQNGRLWLTNDFSYACR
jgi:uncharacterized protein YkwD